MDAGRHDEPVMVVIYPTNNRDRLSPPVTSRFQPRMFTHLLYGGFHIVSPACSAGILRFVVKKIRRGGCRSDHARSPFDFDGICKVLFPMPLACDDFDVSSSAAVPANSQPSFLLMVTSQPCDGNTLPLTRGRPASGSVRLGRFGKRRRMPKRTLLWGTSALKSIAIHASNPRS